MALQFSCAGCGKKYSVDEAYAGKKTQCKACGAALQVPQLPEPDAPDLFGMDHDDDDVVVPRSSEVIRRGGSSRGDEDGNGGVPIWIFAGGGVIALLVLVIGIVMMNGSKPAEAPRPVGNEDTKAETLEVAAEPVTEALSRQRNRHHPHRTWKVKADPSPSAFTLGSDLKWAIEIPDSFSQDDVIFPSTPSPFVLLGGNHNQEQRREVWDLRGPTREGTLPGHVETSKPMALEPLMGPISQRIRTPSRARRISGVYRMGSGPSASPMASPSPTQWILSVPTSS